MAIMPKLIVLLLPLAVFGMPTIEQNDLELVQSRASSNCVCGQENENAGNSQRISGGEVAVANRYPWMVRLTNLPCTFKGKWASCGCGGSLISDRHVLTAYHCIDEWEEYHRRYPNENKENVLVSVHDQYNSRDYQKVKVASVEYPRPTYSHDIAIIVLAEPVTFERTIRPICLPASGNLTYKGQQTTAAGWGATHYVPGVGDKPGKPSGQSRYLKHVNLTVSRHTRDYYLYTDVAVIDGVPQDPCGGDSGGPLMHQDPTTKRWTIIGTVVGRGYNCKTGNTSGEGKWNKVTAHLDWIKDILANDPDTSVCATTGDCDESTWPDKDNGLVCGECKVLVDNMKDKYGTCTAYCNAVGRKCVGAWEESRDTCTVKSTEDCSHNFGAHTSDAICECGDQKGGCTPKPDRDERCPQWLVFCSHHKWGKWIKENCSTTCNYCN